MLVLTIYDMPAIRYSPRMANTDEVVERRINHLAKAKSQFTQFIQASSEEYYYLHFATQWYFSGYLKEHSQKVTTDRDTL